MEYSDCTILRSIGLPKDRIHRVLIICGNVYRFSVFAKHGKNYREFGEFSCYKAAEIEVDGEMILIACHGVSASSTTPMLRELIEMGVKVVIRTGSCGTFKPFLSKPGDLCIVYASIRDDTSSCSEVDIRYPAVADYDVVDCLVDTSKKLGIETNMGINYTSDLYYRKTFSDDILDVYSKHGFVDAEDVELALVFVLASLYGVKAGAILAVDGCRSEWNLGRYTINLGSEKGFINMVKLSLTASSKISKKFFQKLKIDKIKN